MILILPGAWKTGTRSCLTPSQPLLWANEEGASPRTHDALFAPRRSSLISIPLPLHSLLKREKPSVPRSNSSLSTVDFYQLSPCTNQHEANAVHVICDKTTKSYNLFCPRYSVYINNVRDPCTYSMLRISASNMVSNSRTKRLAKNDFARS